MIRKRIKQELFDDVRRAPALPTTAPRERKEMDESKSKKGLAEDYEQEYLQKMNAHSGPLSSKDKQKNEVHVLIAVVSISATILCFFVIHRTLISLYTQIYAYLYEYLLRFCLMCSSSSVTKR